MVMRQMTASPAILGNAGPAVNEKVPLFQIRHEGWVLNLAADGEHLERRWAVRASFPLARLLLSPSPSSLAAGFLSRTHPCLSLQVIRLGVLSLYEDDTLTKPFETWDLSQYNLNSAEKEFEAIIELSMFDGRGIQLSRGQLKKLEKQVEKLGMNAGRDAGTEIFPDTLD